MTDPELRRLYKEASRASETLVGRLERYGGDLEGRSDRRPARSQIARLGQDGLRATLRDVTIILGERRLKLTTAEARELHDQVVERNLAVLAFQSELGRAIGADPQADPGQHEIPADEEMRQELLLCLDAIEDELPLTEGLRGLRQASRVPITPRPEY